MLWFRLLDSGLGFRNVTTLLEKEDEIQISLISSCLRRSLVGI